MIPTDQVLITKGMYEITSFLALNHMLFTIAVY